MTRLFSKFEVVTLAKVLVITHHSIFKISDSNKKGEKNTTIIFQSTHR